MIRRITPQDWVAFDRIRREMLQQAPGAFGATLESWCAKSAQDIRDWIGRTHLVGLFDTGAIQACAGYYVLPGSRVAHRAQVVAVYVQPDLRGRGQGAAVLRHLAREAHAAGLLQLELEVAAGNTAARRCYDRLGYTRTGRIPRAMREAEGFADDITMVLRLYA